MLDIANVIFPTQAQRHPPRLGSRCCSPRLSSASCSGQCGGSFIQPRPNSPYARIHDFQPPCSAVYSATGRARNPGRHRLLWAGRQGSPSYCLAFAGRTYAFVRCCTIWKTDRMCPPGPERRFSLRQREAARSRTYQAVPLLPRLHHCTRRLHGLQAGCVARCPHVSQLR